MKSLQIKDPVTMFQKDLTTSDQFLLWDRLSRFKISDGIDLDPGALLQVNYLKATYVSVNDCQV